jgi:hypothetical protein
MAGGSLHGVVTDPSGLAVAKVTVKVRLQNTGLEASALTDDDGLYRFVLLPPGDFDVSFEKASFAPVTLRGIRVTIGESASLDRQLEIGQVRSSIEVTGATALIESERTHQANTLEREAIENLPINRRDYLTFALLAPGIADSTSLADNADFRVKQTPTSGLSFYGNNGRGNSVTLDGGEMNDLGGGVRATVSQEAVQEFEINRSNYSAELGGASGGVINIVSKSGTNSKHGSLFGFFRDDVLDAGNPYARVLRGGQLVGTKPPSNREQFGASLGGPIRKDRTFFFAALESLIRNESAVVTLYTDPSIFNITPAQNAVLNALPAGEAAQLRGALTMSPATIALFQDNGGVFPYSTHNWLFSTRLDHTFGPNDQFFFRINYSHLQETSANVQALVAASRGTKLHQVDPTAIVHWTHSFGPNAVNEGHIQGNYRDFDVSSLDPYGPELRIEGYGTFNRDLLLPSDTNERRFDIRDGFTWVHGKHTFKTGGEVLIRAFRDQSQVFFGGQFEFGALPGSILNPALPPSFTITALQAFNLGLASTYLQAFGNDKVSAVEPFYSVYAQDSWKVRPNLTLDFGVRYELDRQLPAVPTDKTDVAPRLALAWQPFGDQKTVVRAGYGIFYSPTYFQIDYISQALSIQPNGNRQIAQQFTNILTPGAASSANIYSTLVSQGVITLPVATRSISPADLTQFGLSFAQSGPVPSFALLFDTASSFKRPYSQQSSLSAEHQIGNDLAVSASYTYVHTIRLPELVDVNLLPAPVDPTLGIPVWSSPADFVNPNIAQHNQYESIGRAFYSGMILEMRKRFSRRFSLTANYTLSHATDDNVDYNIDYQANNQTNLRAEHASSSFDERHKVVAYALWNAPGGVQISPVFRANSGRPFNLLVGYDLNQDRHDTTDRPVGAGRNTGIGPDFWTFDMRVAREFRLTESLHIDLLAEGFNLTNHVNYGAVNNVVGNIAGPFDLRGNPNLSPSQPLGFTSALDGRRIQLGVRIRF